ncbi:hypothetical protein BDF21DRAFT_409281, partial [Thamnidium elegans]
MLIFSFRLKLLKTSGLKSRQIDIVNHFSLFILSSRISRYWKEDTVYFFYKAIYYSINLREILFKVLLEKPTKDESLSYSKPLNSSRMS